MTSTLRSVPRTRPKEAAANTIVVLRRVAIGPSLGQWRHLLQDQLGPEWLVVDLMSWVQPPASADVIVLGTPDIPVGAVEVNEKDVTAWVLVGTKRSVPNTMSGEAIKDREVVNRLAGIVETVGAHSHSAARAA